jgi:hypothetical protein
MSITSIILPILAFITGMISLFMKIENENNRFRKKIFVTSLSAAMVVMCIFEINNKINDANKAEQKSNDEYSSRIKAEQNADFLRERIKELNQILLSFKAEVFQKFTELTIKSKETVKTEIIAKNIIKKEEFGYAYYGLKNEDESWDSRYFKKTDGKEAAFPQIGDVVVATMNVNARAGYIDYVEGKGWINKKTVGAIKPGDKLNVVEINRILGSFIWIKFKRI